MPSSVELCFLDTVFKTDEPRSTLRSIHVFGVPGYRKRLGQLVISPSVQVFLKAYMIDILFAQSVLMRDCPFDTLQLWLVDTSVKMSKGSYQSPVVTEADYAITSGIETSRLKIIYVLSEGLKERASDVWEGAVETLMRSLFVEFINLVSVPLYFIKNPTLNAERPKPDLDLYPESPEDLIFDAIIVKTL